MLRHCDLAPVFLRVFAVEGFGLRVRSHGLLVRFSFGHFSFFKYRDSFSIIFFTGSRRSYGSMFVVHGL